MPGGAGACFETGGVAGWLSLACWRRFGELSGLGRVGQVAAPFLHNCIGVAANPALLGKYLLMLPRLGRPVARSSKPCRRAGGSSRLWREQIRWSPCRHELGR